jgi:hypothetical protein
METKQVPFDIYLPATAQREAVKVETIQIEVYTNEHKQEVITPESSALIDKKQSEAINRLATPN